MNLKEAILKYALQNALKFNGRANIGAVIGKLISEEPKLKKDMKKISEEVKKIVAKVNKMKKSGQEKEFKKYKGKIKVKKKKERHGLPALKKAVKGKIVMRFSPSPSGPMHLGHAITILPSSEYCRKYKGKLILRIEDTNPENIYKPAYKMLEEDGQWVTKNNISKVSIQSDNLGYYYDYAEKLVDMGKAYVCTCPSDKFRKMVFEKKACPCRNLPVKKQQERYKKMFSEYGQGEAVLRMKTDLNDKNPAMRDWPIMRINEHLHPRQKDKFRVWPLMNLAVFVDDIRAGMTHIIRGKDHMDNAKRQEQLYKIFKKPVPETMFIGRINFTDLKMSASRTRKKIEYGEYEGWDDIRIPFLRALKRRGYTPDAFIKYSLSLGLSETDKTVTKEEFFKALDACNREFIEPKANRYFFIPEPKKIKIDAAPEQKVELELHPDYPKRGKRKFKTKDSFYITKADFDNLKPANLYRLMDCLNFTKLGSKFIFDSTEYEMYKKKGKIIMHWLPVQKGLVKVELLMPDNTTIKGLGEPLIKKLNPGNIVQFERVGFVRLDKIEKDKFKFWFAHR